MNFSQLSSIESDKECKSVFFQIVPLGYSSANSFYGFLVAAAVLNLAACPFTIFLNALVLVAVKIKRRLQAHSNILLACLALTDLMVGLVAQPLHITKTILLMQGKDFHEFCDIDLAFSLSLMMLVLTTSLHLVLISGERYLAIKHTFTHATVVTKARLIVSSAVAWITAAIFFLVNSYFKVFLFVWPTIIFSTIVLLQILVYKEARRHEKQILSQQVSLQARAKFKQEKKALKLTAILIVTIFVCFILPSIVMFVSWKLFREKLSPDVKTLVRHFSLLPPIINSVINPVIYTVRKRQFRVAFIELLLRKSFQEAEEFERRLFGTTNNAGIQQDEQQGEGQEQNAEERNPVHAENNQEDNPVVLASGFNFDGNTTLATQNERRSLNVLNSMCKTAEEGHEKGKNVAHAEFDLDDNPDNQLQATCSYVDDTSTLATYERISSHALNSTPKKASEEHDEGRNLTHAKSNLEDIREDLATASLATQNELVSLNTLKSVSINEEQKHGEERNPAHAKNNFEDNPEEHASAAKIVFKSVETAQNKNLPVLQTEHDTSKITEKQPQHQEGLEKGQLDIDTVAEFKVTSL